MVRHPRTQPPGPATDGMGPPDGGPVDIGRGASTDAVVLDAVAVRTRDRLTPDRHWPGFVSVRGEGCARVRVSPPLLEQAIAVIDELCRRSRARGWRISTAQHGSAITPFEACVVVHEIHGVVSVIERARQVPHQPTPDEQRQLESGEISTVHKFDRIPTGDLVVSIVPSSSSCQLGSRLLRAGSRWGSVWRIFSTRSSAGPHRSVRRTRDRSRSPRASPHL